MRIDTLHHDIATARLAGIATSLFIVLLLFSLPIHRGEASSTYDVEEKIDVLEPIDVTVQDAVAQKSPPPPRPVPPVVVADEDSLPEYNWDDVWEIVDIDSIPPPPEPEVAQEEEDEPDVFVVVEQMPELVGGLKKLQGGIKYPEIAKKAGVAGTVFVQFVVDENGNVQDAHVARGIGAGCDEEALRAVRQAKFRPGKQRGKSVPVRFALPIRFVLK